MEIDLRELLEPINAGENELKKFLRNQKGISKVVDVSDNPHYWNKDIDLIVYPKTAAAYTAEVKWDSVLSTSGNLFIETLSNIEKKEEGWLEFCEADYLFYGDSNNYKFYIFNFKKLKDFIKENNDSLIKRRAADYSKGGIKKYSEGYLVPISFIKNLIVKEIYL